MKKFTFITLFSPSSPLTYTFLFPPNSCAVSLIDSFRKIFISINHEIRKSASAVRKREKHLFDSMRIDFFGFTRELTAAHESGRCGMLTWLHCAWECAHCNCSEGVEWLNIKFRLSFFEESCIHRFWDFHLTCHTAQLSHASKWVNIEY